MVWEEHEVSGTKHTVPSCRPLGLPTHAAAAIAAAAAASKAAAFAAGGAGALHLPPILAVQAGHSIVGVALVLKGDETEAGLKRMGV